METGVKTLTVKTCRTPERLSHAGRQFGCIFIRTLCACRAIHSWTVTDSFIEHPFEERALRTERAGGTWNCCCWGLAELTTRAFVFVDGITFRDCTFGAPLAHLARETKSWEREKARDQRRREKKGYKQLLVLKKYVFFLKNSSRQVEIATMRHWRTELV